MLKKILTTTLLVSVMAYASMPTVNYDEQFDDAEMENINEHIVDDTLLGLDLQSLTFQEMTVKTPDGKEEQKNVSVKKVKAGEKVVYINRLINQGWVEQRNSKTDKRRKVISISETGLQALENLMDKIRQATSIVTGNLLHNEKMELIRLLNKLNDFHQPIYDRNFETENLLEEALTFKKE